MAAGQISETGTKINSDGHKPSYNIPTPGDGCCIRWDLPPKNGSVMPIKAVNTTKIVRMTTLVKNLLLIPLRRLKSSIMSNTGMAYICRNTSAHSAHNAQQTVYIDRTLHLQAQDLSCKVQACIHFVQLCHNEHSPPFSHSDTQTYKPADTSHEKATDSSLSSCRR